MPKVVDVVASALAKYSSPPSEVRGEREQRWIRVDSEHRARDVIDSLEKAGYVILPKQACLAGHNWGAWIRAGELPSGEIEHVRQCLRERCQATETTTGV